MIKQSSLVLFLVLICSIFFLSCDGIARRQASTGTVALYFTDDMSIYSQVTATINGIQLVSTGSGTVCDVMTDPVAINIANLANIMQLVDVTQCPAGPFNRIHIELDKNVQLMNNSGTPSLCSFVSYKKEDSQAQPDVLACDPATNNCSLDINGAVNVLAQQNNKLPLDFNL